MPEEQITIDRREAIRRVSALLGGAALVGGSALWTGCRSERAPAAASGPFTPAEIAFLYEERDQKIVRGGMQQLDEASRKAANTSFMSATPQARLALLNSLDREQKAYMVSKKEGDPSHYFRMMKELALLGYFTSEIGYTQAQRYAESPGHFEPCIPYKTGELSWAPHA